MNVESLVQIIGSDFYTGVPDSQLKALCNYLMYTYGIDPCHHVIAANEGNATALATGYYLATNKVPVVYMQNSGEGNVLNPVASLLNDKVYRIPVIFIIGWRGEPGTVDEPQHIYQGEITCKLLEVMGISYFVIDKDTDENEVVNCMSEFNGKLAQGRNVAFVVRKNGLSYSRKTTFQNNYHMTREDVIKQIVKCSGEDPIICTTGKASRELFEIRELYSQSHKCDFLTIGAMGHCSAIALGVAVNRPKATVWCIDGDGAGLMHLGAMPVIASCHPPNLIHVIINNGAHESVGGQPTVMRKLNFWEFARDCGYLYCACVSDSLELNRVLAEAKKRHVLTFIEVKCAIGARENLGRPTITALENKMNFMEYLDKF